MSLEVLEKFANDNGNEELLSALNSVKNSFKGNVDRINFLEKDLQKSIEKRDSIKSVVKSKLGIDDITEEALNEFISSKTSTNDESKRLEEMMKQLKLEKDSIESKYSQTVSTYKIEKQLASLGAFSDTESQKAYDIVLSEITNSATFDDNGNVIFKTSDGTTIRNQDGSPVSLSDRYKQIKDSDDFGFLFKTRRSKQGSGATGGKQGGDSTSTLQRSKMSHSEKGKFISEFGQDAYFKLKQ